MKNIYDRRILVKVDGWKEFEDTSIFTHLEYEDEKFAEQEFLFRFETFEEAKKEVEEGWILNATSTTTFFRNRPKLTFKTTNLDLYVSMTEKNFKPIEVKIVFEKRRNLSLKDISELLDADSFCEYLRDRNISSIKF